MAGARKTSPLSSPPLITSYQGARPLFKRHQWFRGERGSQPLPLICSLRDRLPRPLITRCNYSPSFAQGMLIDASDGMAVHTHVSPPWPQMPRSWDVAGLVVHRHETSPEGGVASCQQWQRNLLPPARLLCWPGWVVGVAWATVESEGGRGRPPWGRKGGLLGCCGMVTVILPVGRAWRLFCGTSVHTRRFCCSVHRWKCGWLTGRATGRADFWPFPELCEAIRTTTWGLEVILWISLPLTPVIKFGFL